eukprot:scaffold39648_cov70-Phaeocystis_antarctica.AAC.1
MYALCKNAPEGCQRGAPTAHETTQTQTRAQTYTHGAPSKRHAPYSCKCHGLTVCYNGRSVLHPEGGFSVALITTCRPWSLDRSIR